MKNLEFDLPASLVVFALRNDAVQDKLVALAEQRDTAQNEIEAIMAAADDAERDLTEDETTEIERLAEVVANTNRQIKARSLAKAPSAGRQSRSEPVDTKSLPGVPRKGTTIPATARNAKDVGTFGFDTFGAFAMNVRKAALDGSDGSDARQRLHAATTTYGNEGSGSDGGYLVPPDFRNEIWRKVLGEDSLMTRTEQLVTSGNGITIPADETAPWDTTNGIQAYWESEGGAKTPSKPQFELKSARLNKLICFVPVTDELLEDAPGLDSWLRLKAPQKMTAKLNTAIIRGTGVGQPLGILNSSSLITVSKEASQNASSVYGANISKMWGRLYAPLRRNAVWLINQDVEPQLDFLAFGQADTVSPVPLYLPNGGLSASPFNTLKGRPVIPVEALSTAGTLGDIILTDLTQYMTVTKGRDIKTDVSIHIYFDQDITAFRFVLRVTGQPMWGRTLTPENGSMTRSWAVTMETRA